MPIKNIIDPDIRRSLKSKYLPPDTDENGNPIDTSQQSVSPKEEKLIPINESGIPIPEWNVGKGPLIGAGAVRIGKSEEQPSAQPAPGEEQLPPEKPEDFQDMDKAIKYSLDHGLPEPKSIAEFKQNITYLPPYTLTEEQHGILQDAIPITEWNAQAAYWAGIPLSVIQEAIRLGGANIGRLGYAPNPGDLKVFFNQVRVSFANSERLNIAGINPEDLTKLIQADYDARLKAGIAVQGGGSNFQLITVDSNIIQEGTQFFRVSGSWEIDPVTQESTFFPDGKYKVPVLPTNIEGIEGEIPKLIKPATVGAQVRPQLPTGFTYGAMDNTFISPGGKIYQAKDDAEFKEMLQVIGVNMPSLEYVPPAFMPDFYTFDELQDFENTGKKETAFRGLVQMTERGIITPQDALAYQAGEISLSQLNDKTGGAFAVKTEKPIPVPVPENLKKIEAEVRQNPTQFYELLQQNGRTIETESLLHWLGATDDEIAKIYPGQPKQPTVYDDLETNFEAVDIIELGEKLKALDIHGDKKDVAQVFRTCGVEPALITAYLNGEKTGVDVALEHMQSGNTLTFDWNPLDLLAEGDRWWAAMVTTMALNHTFVNNLIEDQLATLTPDERRKIAPAYGHENGWHISYAPGALFISDNPAYDDFVKKLNDAFLGWDKSDTSFIPSALRSLNLQNPMVMRARYDAWKSGPGIKGFGEVVNPVYLIPIGKGVKFALEGLGFLSKATKLTRTSAVIEKLAGKVPHDLNIGDALAAPLSYPLRKAGGKAAKAIMPKIAKRLNIIIPDPTKLKLTDIISELNTRFKGRIKGDAVTKIAKTAKIVKANYDDLAAGAIDMTRSRLNNIGNLKKMMGVNADGFVDNTRVILSPPSPSTLDETFLRLEDLVKSNRLAPGDVIENHRYFDFIDPKVEEWIDTAMHVQNTMADFADKYDIKIHRRVYSGLREFFTRRVTGVKGLADNQIRRTGTYVASLTGKAGAEKQRFIDMMVDGIDRYDYDDPLEALLAYQEGIYRRIGNVQATRILETMSRHPGSETHLGQFAKWLGADADTALVKAKQAVAIIQRLKRGEVLSGSTRTALKRTLPELSDLLDEALSYNKESFQKLISSISNDMWARLKVKPEEFLAKLDIVRNGVPVAKDNPVTIAQIKKAIGLLTKDQFMVQKITKHIYSRAYEVMDLKQKQTVDLMLEEAKKVLGEAKVTRNAAAAQKKKIMDYLNHVGLTDARSPETGQIFADIKIDGREFTGAEIENAVAKAFNEKVESWAKGLSTLSRGFVTVEASLDFSAPMIQGLFALGQDVRMWLHGKPSAIWAKSFGMHIASMFDPNVTAAFRTRYKSIYDEFIPQGMITGQSGTEFYEASSKIGRALAHAPTALKIPATIVNTVFGRASFGFSSFGEMVRVMGISSMEDAWRASGKNQKELANLWNIMTGVVSTRAMGVSAQQRAVESFALFAPRYLRSQLIVLGNLFSRGATANEIRKIVGLSMMAWTGVYVIMSVFNDQDPHLNPAPEELGGDGSKFMKLNINGTWVGLPGFFTMMRNVVSIVANLSTAPGRFAKVDWDKFDMNQDIMNDPLVRDSLRMPFSKSSPLINLTKEIMTGRDFLGRRLDSVEDWGIDILQKVMPIMAQNLVTRDKPATPLEFATQLFGLNSYAQTEMEIFNNAAYPAVMEMMDELDLTPQQREALDKGIDKFNWYVLGDLSQRKILQVHPELKTLLDTAEVERQQWSSAEWVQYNAGRDRIKKDRDARDIEQIKFLQDAAKKDFTTKEFRDMVSKSHETAWNESQNEQKQPYFVNVVGPQFDRSLAKKKDQGFLEDFDIALDEWWNYVLNDEGITGLTDEERFNARQDRIDKFIKKYGKPTYDQIQTITNEKMKDVDPLLYKLAQDKLKLQAYWDLVDAYGNADRTSREAYRQDPANKEVEAILLFWGYNADAKNPDAVELVKQWQKEFNIPDKGIGVFSKTLVPIKAADIYKITQKEWDEYNGIDTKFTRDDQKEYARWQFRLAHPGFNAFMMTEKGMQDARLKVMNPPESDEFLKLYAQYEKLRNADGSADLKKRKQFRETHPSFDRDGVTFGYWQITLKTALNLPGFKGK
jgi:hypothetical protein